MKIVGLTPKNSDTGETPEERYLRKLRDLGHEVIIGEQFSHISKDTDVVVAMSEVSCENAFKLASAYNLPFYAHMEWLPKWRIFWEHENQWGYDGALKDILYNKKMNFVRMYQYYSMFWALADVKSLAADCFHTSMKDFTGRKLDIVTKRLGIDMDNINKYLSGIREKKCNEVTCVARFVPHKRIHHVIEALGMINFNGTLNLVGYGELKSYYETISKLRKINIKFYNSNDKFKCMDRAKVTVALWSGLVPAESMYLGTPVLTYESEYMKELFDDTLTYSANNSIPDLAYNLNYFLSEATEKDREQFCNYGKECIENNTINTYTEEEAVKLLETFIKTAIEVKK